MSALSGARTRLSTRIYIWGGTSGLLGQGLYLGDYGSRIHSSSASTTKSSVPNGPGNRLAFERPVKKPVLVHPEVSASTLSSSKMQFDRKAQDRCSQDNNSRQHM